MLVSPLNICMLALSLPCTRSRVLSGAVLVAVLRVWDGVHWPVEVAGLVAETDVS